MNQATKTDAMPLIAQDRAGTIAQAHANSDVVEPALEDIDCAD